MVVTQFARKAGNLQLANSAAQIMEQITVHDDKELQRELTRAINVLYKIKARELRSISKIHKVERKLLWRKGGKGAQ